MLNASPFRFVAMALVCMVLSACGTVTGPRADIAVRSNMPSQQAATAAPQKIAEAQKPAEKAVTADAKLADAKPNYDEKRVQLFPVKPPAKPAQPQSVIASVPKTTVIVAPAGKIVEEQPPVPAPIEPASGEERPSVIVTSAPRKPDEEPLPPSYPAVRIYFGHGSSKLDGKGLQLANQYAQGYLKGPDENSLRLEGHASRRTPLTGSPLAVKESQANMRVSLARAVSVMRALMAQGVEAGDIGLIAWGDRKPAQATDGMDVEAASRRVEIFEVSYKK